MSLKIVSAVCLNGMLMVCEDEHGKEQAYIRLWPSDPELSEHEGGGGNCLYLTGKHQHKKWLQLTQEEVDRVEPILVEEMKKFTAEVLDVKEDEVRELLEKEMDKMRKERTV